MHFSYEKLNEAARALDRLNTLVSDLITLSGDMDRACDTAPSEQVRDIIEQTRHEFINATNNDLNMSRAMGAIFSLSRQINSMIASGGFTPSDACAVLVMLEELDSITAVLDIAGRKNDIPSELMALIQRRHEARKKQDWKAADDIREQLAREGIEVVDTPSGPIWRRVDSR